MKKFFQFGICILTLSAQAQDSARAKAFQVHAYIEVYYSYDFSNPANHEKPAFLYNFKRHNEVSLNLGFIKAAYANEKIRANLSLMAGTYAQYNMAAEQDLLKNFYEGNAGFKVSKQHNLWLDVGIFASHLGFESALGKDCWTLTRSLAAENSPYYEAGAKLGYTTKNEKIYLAAMYLNGWQRIQRPPANQTPAFGTQINIKPNGKTLINLCSFVGNDKPDSLRQWRIFNNFYALWQLSPKFGITAGFDLGIEQQKKDTSAFNKWYTPQIVIKYNVTDKVRLAARVEYYSDENEVIVSTGTTNGFQTFGYSLNADYSPFENLMVRLEGRVFNSKDQIFILDGQPDQLNYCVTTSLAFSF